MKILRKGAIPAPPTPWWVDLELSCPVCGTVVLLEASDSGAIQGTQERRPGGERKISIACPLCRGMMGYSDHGETRRDWRHQAGRKAAEPE